MANIINSRSKINWNAYTACEYAEGFGSGENATQIEQIEAFAFLIKTGMAWTLQGCYGRAAAALISQNIISRDGVINWIEIESINN